MKRIQSLILLILILVLASCSSSTSNCKESGDGIICNFQAKNSNGNDNEKWFNSTTRAYFDCSLDESEYGIAELKIYDSEDNLVLSDTIIKNGKIVVAHDTTDTGYTGYWRITTVYRDFTGKFQIKVSPTN